MKRFSLSKTEIILCILMAVSIPLYALALKRNDLFVWLCIADWLAMMALSAIFILPKLLKQMKQEKKQKEETRFYDDTAKW